MTWTGVKNFLRNWDLHLEAAAGILVFLITILATFGVATQKVLLASIGWSVAGVSAIMVREHRERRGLTRRNEVFADEREAFDQLDRYIQEHEVKRAILLQYSGSQSKRILEAILLKNGVAAELFIQHEETAAALRSQRQVDLIKNTTNSLIRRNENVPNSSTFKIYKFRVPISMRAILIDDKVLCAGWYTFEAKDRSGKQVYPDDPISIAGKDRPTILAWHGTEDFGILRHMIESLATSYREDSHIEKVQM
jgi:hypothetical protein